MMNIMESMRVYENTDDGWKQTKGKRYKNSTLLYDWGSEKCFIGSEWNNGDWNLRIATKITFLEEYLSEEEIENTGKYEVSLLAVSPDACGKNNVDKAIESMGLEQEQVDRIPLIQYEALIEYGIYAPLWSESGDNLKELLKKANDELQTARGLFGFYMDKRVNMIGDTGWDWIAGDVGASLRRWQEEKENSNEN